MKRVLVIVPFAMSEDELGRRKDQLKAVKAWGRYGVPLPAGSRWARELHQPA